MKYSYMRSHFVGACAAIFIGLHCAPGAATEGGGSSYPAGSSMHLSGAMPPDPGFYGVVIPSYFSATRMNDGDGDKVKFPGGFKVEAASLVHRSFYVWDTKILGANLASQAVTALVKLDSDIAHHKDKDAGLADITISPAILGWHFGQNLTLVLGYDVVVPVGKYDSSRSLNVGRNYWSHNIVTGLAYIDRNGLTFQISPRLLINQKNNDTDYKSGTEFEMDFVAGWSFGPLNLGVAGYYYKQLSDDEVGGAKIRANPLAGIFENGNRGEAFAIGPKASYFFGPATGTISWQPDLYSKNRTQGNTVWAHLAYKL